MRPSLVPDQTEDPSSVIPQQASLESILNASQCVTVCYLRQTSQTSVRRSGVICRVISVDQRSLVLLRGTRTPGTPGPAGSGPGLHTRSEEWMAGQPVSGPLPVTPPQSPISAVVGVKSGERSGSRLPAPPRPLPEQAPPGPGTRSVLRP